MVGDLICKREPDLKKTSMMEYLNQRESHFMSLRILFPLNSHVVLTILLFYLRILKPNNESSTLLVQMIQITTILE